MVKSYTVEGYLSCEENDERPGIYFNKEDLLGEHDLGSIPNIFFIDEFAKFNGKKVKITIQEVEENTTSCETLSTAHCGAGAYIKILKNCTGCIHWPAPVGASNGGYPCDHCKAVENGKPTNWRG